MKIEIIKTIEVKETVEVEFPLFRQIKDTLDNGASYNIVYRINETGTATIITHNYYHGKRTSVEVKHELIDLSSRFQTYYNMEKITEGEFYAERNEAVNFITSYPK